MVVILAIGASLAGGCGGGVSANDRGGNDARTNGNPDAAVDAKDAAPDVGPPETWDGGMVDRSPADSADPSPEDGASSDASADTTGADASPKTLCGFTVPNPASSGLPNAAVYDNSVPDVVTDKITGLAWEASLRGRTPPPGCSADSRGQLRCPLRYAADYCASNRLGGHSDWRLPTIHELISLVNVMAREPAMDATAFPDAPFDAIVWSSTRMAGRPDLAWFVGFYQGSQQVGFIDNPLRVRCVRVAATSPERCYEEGARFTLQDELAFDKATGLTWRRNDSASEGKNWTDAAAYCTSLGDGFRMPSINELTTILDFSQSPSTGHMIDVKVFPRPNDWYWSSSAIVGEYPDVNAGVWSLTFAEGSRATATESTVGINRTRCVR